MIDQSFRSLVVDSWRLPLATVWSKLEYNLLHYTEGPSSDPVHTALKSKKSKKLGSI